MNRSNFVLCHTSEYERDFKKIARKDKLLASKVLDVSEKLSVNPFSVDLRTHMVRISSLGRVYSSRVSGDIRILSGGSNVYK